MSQTKIQICIILLIYKSHLDLCRGLCLKGIRHIGHIVSNDAYSIVDVPVIPWLNLVESKESVNVL